MLIILTPSSFKILNIRDTKIVSESVYIRSQESMIISFEYSG